MWGVVSIEIIDSDDLVLKRLSHFRARSLNSTALPAMVEALKLPASFQLSYEEFESYPQNLIFRTPCTAISKAYKAKLDELNEVSLKLFIEKDEVADVPFLDFRGLSKSSHCSRQGFCANIIYSF